MSARTSRQAAERRGRWAEQLCVIRLRLSGWRILARRYAGLRGTRIGEIDLVARRGKTVAFIEVKARAQADQAVFAVTKNQQHRIEQAATLFLARHPGLGDCTARFDVMILGSGLWPRHLVDAWRP